MHSGSYSVEILRLASAAEQTPALSHVIIIRSVGGIASTLMCPEMRKKLFTDGVLAQIPHWMREEGLGPAELAARIGCTVGSLRVACSRYGLSLRRPTRSHGRDRQYNQAPGRPDPAELVLTLPEEIRERLRTRAAFVGISELELLTLLIETIDRDDLYSAILDDGR
jgi:hypothetical protein